MSSRWSSTADDSGGFHDGKPSYTVSIMELSGDKVARETQYFADPFVPPSWRARWAARSQEVGVQ